jgi:predicted nuclease of restriction endonuclease-like (RecB) superfamily
LESKYDIAGCRDIAPLIGELRELINSARNAAARAISTLQVALNFAIGRRIVEHEQKGAKRAEYGKALLKELATALTREFGKGFSETNLKLMRKFYLTYRSRISQTSSDIFLWLQKGQTQSDQLPGSQPKILQTDLSDMSSRVSRLQGQQTFTLSWSHYVFLMAIKSQDERCFYEIEAAKQNWSLRELKRQYNSGLYERLALSRDKERVHKLSTEGQIVEQPEDLLKNPYVLEFLGLEEKERYTETELESAIINKLEHFLLELGKGFLFEARQKRFTFNEEHFYVDLVFYNRLLRCYVLIDLKIGKLSHQDLGQMQMYVHYFDRYIKQESENQTIGIILCKQKNDALVEITLPRDANIHAREYQLYLPDKEELRRKLLDWMAEQETE